MFAVLLKEMKNHSPRIKQKDIAMLLNKSVKAVNERFNGKIDWDLKEMIAIRNCWFPNYTLDDLFQKI